MVEAGGVELRSRIENTQLADLEPRSRRRKLTNSGFLVHGLYTDSLKLELRILSFTKLHVRKCRCTASLEQE